MYIHACMHNNLGLRDNGNNVANNEEDAKHLEKVEERRAEQQANKKCHEVVVLDSV